MKKTIIAITLLLPSLCLATTVPVKVYNTTNGAMSITYKVYESSDPSIFTLSINPMSTETVYVESTQGIEVITAQSNIKNKDGSIKTAYANFETYSCVAQAGNSQHQAVMIFRPIPSENFLGCSPIGDNFQN